MSESGETVVDRQNSPRGMKLLRARSEIYQRAARLQKAQFTLTVLVPFVGAVLGLLFEDARSYVAASSLVIAILDIALFDRAQRNQLKLAARISELFDSEVLDIPWSSHAAGARPNPEQINEAAAAWRLGDDNLKDWYPSAVANAPLYLARIICQRTNLWYDAEVRRRYSSILLGVGLTAFTALFVVGLTQNMTVIDFVATILTPAAPILNWTLRDFYRQRDAAESQTIARSEVDQLWALVLEGKCDSEECIKRSRELQNTIFTRRSTNPLVFPGIYNRLRPSMEIQMNAGAEELLAQVRNAIPG